ncbi:MAG: STAS domain-containing protein [Thermodesulfobacteriota bacterium]|nr:STAS domain-containing protein [Thermodesulfobacteriota bacterium]
MGPRHFSTSQDGHGAYCLKGELSINDLEELRDFLEECRQGRQEIAISLAEVRFIDTAALQLLIAFKKGVEPDVKLRISAVSAEVDDILSLCGLKSALL